MERCVSRGYLAGTSFRVSGMTFIEGPAAQRRSRVSSSGAGEPPRKRRLLFISPSERGRSVAESPIALDSEEPVAQGTLRRGGEQDHSAIFSCRTRLYAPGTKFLRKGGSHTHG